MFERDSERFADGLERINVLPLGSGALAGTTFPIDRVYVAKLLGFPRISKNSIDAVSDRDFLLEFLAAASISVCAPEPDCGRVGFVVEPRIWFY